MLGTPVAVSLPGASCALAVTFRHTIMRSETCGYDVHYEPLELTGVAILRRSGRRFRTVAAGHFVMRALGALSVNEDGTLTNTFVQSLEATWPFYVGRLLGGSVFFFGMLVMAYNVVRTISKPGPVERDEKLAVLAGGRA